MRYAVCGMRNYVCGARYEVWSLWYDVVWATKWDKRYGVGGMRHACGMWYVLCEVCSTSYDVWVCEMRYELSGSRYEVWRENWKAVWGMRNEVSGMRFGMQCEVCSCVMRYGKRGKVEWTIRVVLYGSQGLTHLFHVHGPNQLWPVADSYWF